MLITTDLEGHRTETQSVLGRPDSHWIGPRGIGARQPFSPRRRHRVDEVFHIACKFRALTGSLAQLEPAKDVLARDIRSVRILDLHGCPPNEIRDRTERFVLPTFKSFFHFSLHKKRRDGIPSRRPEQSRFRESQHSSQLILVIELYVTLKIDNELMLVGLFSKRNKRSRHIQIDVTHMFMDLLHRFFEIRIAVTRIELLGNLI